MIFSTLLFKIYLLLAGALMPLAAYAADTKIGTLIEQMTGLLRLVLTGLFTLAVAAFAWGIVKLIAASGNPEELKKARGILWWGVIGMAVLASIGGLIAFLQANVLSGEDPATPIHVPQFQ